MTFIKSRSGGKLRIVLSGLVGLWPLGGVAWDYLQYAIGLSRLGHDVYYVEDINQWCFDPRTGEMGPDGEYAAQFLGDFFAKYAPELKHHWRLVVMDREYGMNRADFERVLHGAELYVDISGMATLPAGLPGTCPSVFLDTDPGYNQILLEERPSWANNVDRWAEAVKQFDRHFTYAENIHGPDCLVPGGGFEWQTTRMPIVLDCWRDMAPASPAAPWTTVTTWNGFRGPLEYGGRGYGSKNVEFEKLLDLPSRVSVPICLAVGGARVPRELLDTRGWQTVEATAVTPTPQAYSDFIQGSRGEISAAKNVYVDMRTGWFSCRSACYLAAGRPVVVQDTGFRHLYPVGVGLMTFADVNEAADALQEVERDYQRHSQAARAVAAESLDSDKVLNRFLDDVFAASVATSASRGGSI
jgi:hypothetical protein